MAHRTGARRGLGLLVGMALVAAACGGDDDDARRATPTGGTDAEVEAVFPAEVEHAFGTTVVEEAPERVVTVGYNDQDFVLAFGVEPVAVRWWYGPEDDATQAWTDDLLTADEPKVLVMPELNLEAVAAERPDLIVGVYSGMTEAEYEQLSQIAPTVAQSGDHHDYGMPWQEVTRSIGTALGQPDTAEQLVTDLEARFADVRAAHPEWAGRSVTVATASPDDLSFFASQDPRVALLPGARLRGPGGARRGRRHRVLRHDQPGAGRAPRPRPPGVGPAVLRRWRAGHHRSRPAAGPSRRHGRRAGRVPRRRASRPPSGGTPS